MTEPRFNRNRWELNLTIAAHISGCLGISERLGGQGTFLDMTARLKSARGVYKGYNGKEIMNDFIIGPHSQTADDPFLNFC